MAWDLLKAAIDSALPTNGSNSITASGHRTILKSVTDTIGSLPFKGIATPTTDPGSPDGEVFWITLEAGTYTNFDGLVVAANELTFLKWNGTVWTKEFINITFDASTLVEYDSLADAKTALGAEKLFIASQINEEAAVHRTVMITLPDA